MALPVINLRSQIFVLLLLFGLAPAGAAILINVPILFDRLQAFYHRAHLLNLRADFRDLDQHLASRHETVRLLANLSAHRGFLGHATRGPDNAMPMASIARLNDWLNLILQDQLDIIQVLFVDRVGDPLIWFERDTETLDLVRGNTLKDPPPAGLVERALELEPGAVLPSPVRFSRDEADDDPARFMMLQLVSPIFVNRNVEPYDTDLVPRVRGAVVVTVDIGGLARAYRDTYWVHSNGNYIGQVSRGQAPHSAFKDFPGLEGLFKRSELGLWRGSDQGQVIWVPLLATDDGRPLWVGRRVDSAPIADVSRAVQWRAGIILILLVGVVLLAARWIAGRAERFREELTTGIGQVLEQGEVVNFSWRGPPELRALGTKLTRLAQAHAENTSALRAHAEQLEESNRYKSEFLTNVSHELRTPLNSILLLSNVLAETDPDALNPAQRKQARVINAAAKDLHSLIDDILDLSRIEARRMAFTLSEIDLVALLEEVIDLVQAQADVKGLNLVLDLQEGGRFTLISDADKLRQIIKNFLSNALKFTDSGEIRLEVGRYRGKDAEGRPIRIAVRDTGIGIPADKHRAIFRAFQQADGSTSRRYGGTGLGLTISRELARLVGGRIELESQVGAGSCFSLLMPERFDRERFDPEQLSEIHTPTADTVVTGPASADFVGRRVLIVENDLRQILALTTTLKAWGITVLAAGDGQEALETLAEDPGFDLILIDSTMPEATKQACVERIRSEDGPDRIPLILMTTDASGEVSETAHRYGAVALLVKPVDGKRLRETLVSLWRKGPRPGQGQEMRGDSGKIERAGTNTGIKNKNK